jgi:Macrocin-O-methyltransferase (TylF)
MDMPIDTNSRLARLPRPLRAPAARAIRTFGWHPRPRYAYEADGLATVHFSPFMEDREFSILYEDMAAEWFVGYHADVRWRMWLLTRFARQCEHLSGNFAEFGVYRGGCAFMVLATTRPDPDRTLYLFDTFAGIPDIHLAERERSIGLAGLHADTSVQYVEQRLQRWRGRFEVRPGDVFETLTVAETGPLAFAHVDLNTSAPTRHVLEYVYPRLVPGAIVVFDDYGYGWQDCEDERIAIEAFCAGKAESVIALPTGQGCLIKQ